MNLCGRVIMQSKRHISPTFVPQYRRCLAFMAATGARLRHQILESMSEACSEPREAVSVSSRCCRPLEVRERSRRAFDFLEEVARLQKVARTQPNLLAIQGLEQKVIGAQEEGAVASDISIVGGEHDHGKKTATLP